MYRFRVKMAAMGSVEDSVEVTSGVSAALDVGSWYGTTADIHSLLPCQRRPYTRAHVPFVE